MNFVKFLVSQNFCLDPYKTYYFQKEHDEVFQMDINKLLS